MKKKKLKKITLDDFQLESFLTKPASASLNALRGDGSGSGSGSGTFPAASCPINLTYPALECLGDLLTWPNPECTPPVGETSDMGTTCKTQRNQCPPPPPPLSPTSLNLICPPGACPTAPYISCTA